MDLSVSILSVDNKRLWIEKLNDSKSDYIHFDVIDGKFAEKKVFSIKEIEEYSNISKKAVDVHLMVVNPDLYIKKMLLLNINYITFHIELKKDIYKLISLVKESGIKCGLAVDIDTEVETVFPYLELIDMVLIMSVKAGAGGQVFQDKVITKIDKLKNEIMEKKLNVKIEVDGGINLDNLSLLKDHNVDIIVMGSYITSHDNYKEVIEEIKKAA